MQSCSGAWAWLIILVTISCTGFSMYFLLSFSNFIHLVPVLVTAAQLCTFLTFQKTFVCLILLSL